jgi:signal transduction histidine kinase
MKIGTRLALVLLTVLTPIVVLYTSFNFQLSSRVYLDNLQRETRATTRGLRAALFNDIETQEWDQVRSVLQQIRDQGTEAVMFKPDRTLWFALPAFPKQLLPDPKAFGIVDTAGDWQVNRETANRFWLCRLVPLRSGPGASIGYLLVAVDLTEVRETNRRRLALSIVGTLLVLAMAAAFITLATRRYVTRPLSELSRRVSQFSSNDDASERSPGRNEVEFLSEEFRRLDAQLSASRERLLREHRRQLELERNLRHSDKLATIGTLASGLAHEIGSPMAVIRGRAEYLLNDPAPDRLCDGLGIIIAQIDRISGIVHRLLDYARRREPQRVRSDLRPIVMRALSLLETEASRLNVRMQPDLGPQPLVLDCDSDQLQQVFVNLGMNALDAMAEQGGGVLRVTANFRRNGSGGWLSIIFEDDGPGVAEENRAQIFDPFFTTKPPGRGTGMGLAVSQSIVQDHEGEITMEPSGERGARFFVTFPMASEPAEQAQAQA